MTNQVHYDSKRDILRIQLTQGQTTEKLGLENGFILEFAENKVKTLTILNASRYVNVLAFKKS